MTKSKFPPRWRFRSGKFRYRPHPDQRYLWDGKVEFTLGKTEADAWRTWFERTGTAGHDDVQLMGECLEAFYREYVLGSLSPGSHESYRHGVNKLKVAFAHMRPGNIKPSHAYAYRKKRAEAHLPAANREVSILSSCLTFAVENGWIDHNPLRGQITRRGKYAEKPRTREPSYDELAKFCDVVPSLRGYVILKLATSLRKGQMLALDLSNHWDAPNQELRPPVSKGGKDTIYEDAGPLVKLILKDRIPRGPLFCNEKGARHTITGFNSKWQRAMRKYVRQGGEHFREHDIRTTAANRADNLKHAQMLLGHQDPKTTLGNYRNRPEKVKSLSVVGRILDD